MDLVVNGPLKSAIRSARCVELFQKLQKFCFDYAFALANRSAPPAPPKKSAASSKSRGLVVVVTPGTMKLPEWNPGAPTVGQGEIFLLLFSNIKMIFGIPGIDLLRRTFQEQFRAPEFVKAVQQTFVRVGLRKNQEYGDFTRWTGSVPSLSVEERRQKFQQFVQDVEAGKFEYEPISGNVPVETRAEFHSNGGVDEEEETAGAAGIVEKEEIAGAAGIVEDEEIASVSGLDENEEVARDGNAVGHGDDSDELALSREYFSLPRNSKKSCHLDSFIVGLYAASKCCHFSVLPSLPLEKELFSLCAAIQQCKCTVELRDEVWRRTAAIQEEESISAWAIRLTSVLCSSISCRKTCSKHQENKDLEVVLHGGQCNDPLAALTKYLKSPVEHVCSVLTPNDHGSDKQSHTGAMKENDNGEMEEAFSFCQRWCTVKILVMKLPPILYMERGARERENGFHFTLPEGAVSRTTVMLPTEKEEIVTFQLCAAFVWIPGLVPHWYTLFMEKNHWWKYDDLAEQPELMAKGASVHASACLFARV